MYFPIFTNPWRLGENRKNHWTFITSAKVVPLVRAAPPSRKMRQPQRGAISALDVGSWVYCFRRNPFFIPNPYKSTLAVYSLNITHMPDITHIQSVHGGTNLRYMKFTRIFGCEAISKDLGLRQTPPPRSRKLRWKGSQKGREKVSWIKLVHQIASSWN